jgi:isoquinoline 1-oxidoreductase subunit beta
MSRTPSVLTRRDFLGQSALVGGGLLIALSLPSQGVETGSSGGTLNAFIRVGTDDTITLITPAVEMGQGGHTAMAMLLMDELNGDWHKLAVIDAPADPLYNNPMVHLQITAGSFSVRGWYNDLRKAGALAREMLTQAGANTLGVPVAECVASNSRVVHPPSGRSVTYGSVAEAAAKLPPPAAPTYLGAQRVVGTSPNRLDVPQKVDGSARFGIDMDLPNMVYAVVRGAPTLTGKLKSCDASRAQQAPGFIACVEMADAVIVVADGYWRAKKALDLIHTEWDAGKLAGVDSKALSQRLHAAFDEPGIMAKDSGDVQAARRQAAHTLEAVYEVPFLAHACMEPMNCTAVVTEQGCDIYCGTQSPQAAQAAAAQAIGMPSEKVSVHTQYLGGGFGRRGEADFAAQAAKAAQVVGRPVKLIWSREEDLSHDYYRPAAAIQFKASFDSHKTLTGLECKVVSASAPNGNRKGAPYYTGSVYDNSYAYTIENFRTTGVNLDSGVRFGYWRSVNDSHNPFMLEGFMDECAHYAGIDPLEYRRRHLKAPEASRHLNLLNFLADKAGYDKRPKGRFHGIAAFPSFGSVIGCVVEVSVQGKQITIHRVINAVDCGIAVHPDNIIAQLQGGMVYGLTAVLRGEISLKNGQVVQQNFTDYPLLTLSEMPRTECYILPSQAAPGGIGEPGTGPIAPALANAIYAATRARIRSLPLTKSGFTIKIDRRSV